MSVINNKEEATVRGIHTISICKATSDLALKIQSMIERVSKTRAELLKSGASELELLKQWEEYTYWIDQLHKKFLVRQQVCENLTTTAGRSVVVQRLAGITTYTGIVNYGLLGTSSTGPVVGNTQLGAEVYRKPLSSGTFSANVGILENFYNATDVVNTFQEYGFSIDGTGSANTGVLWNRWTAVTAKSGIETMNTQSSITLNSV